VPANFADPFSGKPLCLVPALNPDVGLIHAHQADIYGNSRVLRVNTAPLEQAMASRWPGRSCKP